MKSYLKPGLASLLVFFVLATVSVGAKTRKQSQPRGRSDDASRHASEAAKVFKEIMGAPDKGVPRNLLDKAQAIAVFPGVLKGAFGVGGRAGKGVISRRIAGGWSAPAFFELGGLSLGAQIGGAKTDYVMLIMNDTGMNSLLSDKIDLGGEMGVAAGPYGREASAETDLQLKAGILTYSRSKGAFAGVAIKGGTISPDNDLNQAFYGMKASGVLDGTNQAGMPREVSIFPRTLSRYSRK